MLPLYTRTFACNYIELTCSASEPTPTKRNSLPAIVGGSVVGVTAVAVAALVVVLVFRRKHGMDKGEFRQNNI